MPPGVMPVIPERPGHGQRHVSTSSLPVFLGKSSFLKMNGVSALCIKEKEIGSSGELSTCLSFLL